MTPGAVVTADEQAAAFARDGFLVVPDLFPAEEMQETKQEIARILESVRAEEESGGTAYYDKGGVFVGLSQRSQRIHDLARDHRILDILERIYATNIEFLSDKIVSKSADTRYGSPWHQDYPYWRGAHKISVWLALDDATVQNGCMKLMPGSHRAESVHDGTMGPEGTFNYQLRQDTVDESQAVTAAVRAGGAVFFHDLALHSSHPNVTGKDRWAWVGTYRDAMADDLKYNWSSAAAVVRGHGREG